MTDRVETRAVGGPARTSQEAAPIADALQKAMLPREAFFAETETGG